MAAVQPGRRFCGTSVFDVLEQSPERLLEIDGIGKKRSQKITSDWADQKDIQKSQGLDYPVVVVNPVSMRCYVMPRYNLIPPA